MPANVQLFFFQRTWELVGLRYLLMPEPGDFDRPAHRTIHFENPIMSTEKSIILVVEDDDIVRMLIVDVLEELEFEVLEADGCEQALAFLNDEDQYIDLMMTDVGLPVMDGRELATQARLVRPELPILFASGYAESLDVPAGMHVIGKPFSIDQLRDKVRGILANA